MLRSPQAKGCGRNRESVAESGPNLVQVWGQLRSKSREFDGIRAKSGRRPNSVKIASCWPKPGQLWTAFGQLQSYLRRVGRLYIWPPSGGPYGPNSDPNSRAPGQIRSEGSPFGGRCSPKRSPTSTSMALNLAGSDQVQGDAHPRDGHKGNNVHKCQRRTWPNLDRIGLCFTGVEQIGPNSTDVNDGHKRAKSYHIRTSGNRQDSRAARVASRKTGRRGRPRSNSDQFMGKVFEASSRMRHRTKRASRICNGHAHQLAQPGDRIYGCLYTCCASTLHPTNPTEFGEA